MTGPVSEQGPKGAPPRLGLVVLLLAVHGCASSELPPPTGPVERPAESLRGVRVAVERYDLPVYSDKLRRQLSESGLFERVDSVENVTDPTLIARVERPVYGRAVVPLWTALSLGIIPTTVTEEHGLVFSLRRPGSDELPVTVEATYAGTTTLGWVAALVNLSPNHSARHPEASERYKDFFRSVTAAKARAALDH